MAKAGEASQAGMGGESLSLYYVRLQRLRKVGIFSNGYNPT